MRRSTRTLVLAALLLSFVHAPGVEAKEKTYPRVSIVEPYIELHTGPGRGYPVFHVAERGTVIDILRRRTDWFKVRTEDRREGWVHRRQMTLTLQPTGERTTFEDGTREEFIDHRWEMGVMVGDVDGARVVSTYGAFSFNEHLSAELGASHIMGRFSNSYMATAALTHTFVPEWRVSPFFTLGTGMMRIEPKATLVLPEDRTDQLGFAGLGLRAYLTRRFMLRLEYKAHVVFTSRDDNEEINVWQGGFAFFF
jgi:hypothetical protein